MPKVTITNEETGESKEYKLGYGANLRKSALFQEVDLYKGLNTHLNCRGMGLCGKCVIEPTPLENVNEQTFFEKMHPEKTSNSRNPITEYKLCFENCTLIKRVISGIK